MRAVLAAGARARVEYRSNALWPVSGVLGDGSSCTHTRSVRPILPIGRFAAVGVLVLMSGRCGAGIVSAVACAR